MPILLENSPKYQRLRAYYTDPESPTYENMKKSAERAGYAEATVQGIHSKQWVKDLKLEHRKRFDVMVDEAIHRDKETQGQIATNSQQRLLEVVSIPVTDIKTAGPILTASMFALERLLKDTYSPRSETKHVGLHDIEGVVRNQLQTTLNQYLNAGTGAIDGNEDVRTLLEAPRNDTSTDENATQ